jgi:hypothetical protein
MWRPLPEQRCRRAFARSFLPTLAVVYGAASVSLALNSEFLTTYGTTSWIAAATGLVAGLALILAGTFVSIERPTGSLGPVTTLLGVVWLAQDWAGWVGPALAHSVAMIVAPFMTALLLHLVLAAPGGRIVGRTPRLVVAIVYGTTALYSVGQALFRDPFLDLSCWYNCTGNVFLLRSEPELVRFLDGIWLSFSLIACVVIVVLACWRLLSATRPGRAALQPLLVPAGLAAVSYGAYAVALVVHRAEDPEKAVFHALFLARGFSLASLAAGVSWTVMRTRRTHLAIARLAADLGEAPEPGSLGAALARSLGDELLEVAYRLPDSPLLVDAEARPVSLPDGGSRTATPIVRTARPWRSSSTTVRSRASGNSIGRSAPPHGSRSTTNVYGPRCWLNSKTCARHKPESSRRATRPVGVSSATSTTVHNSDF